MRLGKMISQARRLLAAAVLCLTGIPGIANAAAPNVVLMLADNVGWGDIGAYGGGELRGMPTPRIDSIAAQGLQMTQFLVEPGCTPSRAALMLGRYPIRAGLGTIIIGGTPNTLQADEFTLLVITLCIDLVAFNRHCDEITPAAVAVGTGAGRCRLRA